MAAPAGATVKLYYDSPRAVVAGDYLVTKTGRSYLVLSVRVQARGRHAVHRKHLVCLVQREPPLDAVGRMHPLRWYSRRRRA